MNLRKWSPYYPSPDSLRGLVKQGAISPKFDDEPKKLGDG